MSFCLESDELSIFGKSLGLGSGIGELMEDLGKALEGADEDLCMLGGGQPAHIDEVNEKWRVRMKEILSQDGDFEKMVANYEPPQGSAGFIQALVGLLNREFGWGLTEKNVAITPGGQMAFFLLFNALAGEFRDGRRKKILLPLVPEYIGYADQGAEGIEDGLFQACRPLIEKLGEHSFKYGIDFENLEIGEDVAAVCVSRPTNPSGNVLRDEEIERLRELCREAQVPLIIDNAYGAPFPNVIFDEVKPVWDEGIILTLSLSKLGLPGTRTGMVIAREEVIQAMASMTAITGLANNNIGQALVRPMMESGEILRMSREVICPFYQRKSKAAIRWAEEFFGEEVPYRISMND